MRGFAGTCVEDNIKGGHADSSLMVGTRAFTGEDPGSIPSQGTRIL